MTALRAGGKFVCLSAICSMRNSKAQQRLRTANAIVDAKRGRARTIQLRSLVAKDVPIVVQAGGDYGEGIDGLLGMSFLQNKSSMPATCSMMVSPETSQRSIR